MHAKIPAFLLRSFMIITEIRLIRVYVLEKNENIDWMENLKDFEKIWDEKAMFVVSSCVICQVNIYL